MTYRTFDPSLFNKIANTPGIHERLVQHLADKGAIDFTDCASDAQRWIMLTNGRDACGLFERKHPTVCDGHLLFDRSCRGRAAIRELRQMFNWLFRHTRTLIVTGGAPHEFRDVRMMCRLSGMTSDGVEMMRGEHWTMPYEYFHITPEMLAE